MKNTGKCPKCGSVKVLRVEGYAAPMSSGNVLGTNEYRYICCDCGYVEHWVDVKDIPKLLRQKYYVKPL